MDYIPTILGCMTLGTVLGIGIRVLYLRFTKSNVDTLERHISMLISQYKETTPKAEQSIISLQRFLVHHGISITHTQLVAVLIYYQNGYLIER